MSTIYDFEEAIDLVLEHLRSLENGIQSDQAVAPPNGDLAQAIDIVLALIGDVGGAISPHGPEKRGPLEPH